MKHNAFKILLRYNIYVKFFGQYNSHNYLNAMKKVYFDNADYETFKGMKIQDIDWSNIDHQYNENIPQNKKRDDQSLDSQNWNKKIDMMQFRTKDFEAFKGSINDAEIYEDN